MKTHIYLLLILSFFVHTCLFAKGKVLQSNSFEVNQSTDASDNEMNRLKNLGITYDEYITLPQSIKQRIPVALTKTDSILINTDFQQLTANEDQITSFSSGNLKGNVVKIKRGIYRVVDENNQVIGIFRKSRDGKRVTLLNADGDILLNSMGLSGLFYAIFSLIFLLATIYFYALILGMV